MPTKDAVMAPEVTITGRYPTLSRVKTGLFSLDYALSHKGNLGFPLRVITEVYGYTNAGKSTLSYFLAGKVASEVEKSGITIADVEMADLQYIPAAVAAGGFKGNIKMQDLSDEKTDKPLAHERVLMNLVKDIYKNEYSAAIWDSVGATVPMVEMDTLTDPKAMFGEAFMGKKAKMVSQVVMAVRTALMTKAVPSSFIAINHVHSVIGGRGHTTTGGERLKFLSGTRLMIWKGESFYENDDDPSSPPIGFLVNGQVEKLRFGGPGRKFQYYIVPGFGVHPGVTAMFDAFEITGRLKKAKIDVPYMTAERGARVKLDGKNLGFLKRDLLEYAAEGKRRKFYPFEEIMARFAEDVERGLVNIEEEVEGEDALQPSPVGDEATED
jgi:RecA/RadA recombinase